MIRSADHLVRVLCRAGGSWVASDRESRLPVVQMGSRVCRVVHLRDYPGLAVERAWVCRGDTWVIERTPRGVPMLVHDTAGAIAWLLGSRRRSFTLPGRCEGRVRVVFTDQGAVTAVLETAPCGRSPSATTRVVVPVSLALAFCRHHLSAGELLDWLADTHNVEFHPAEPPLDP